MERSLELLKAIFSEQIFLPISIQDRQKAWKLSQDYSCNSARRTAFINQLMLNKTKEWLLSPNLPETAKITTREDLHSIWEFVTGTPIELDEVKIILIPNESTDNSTFYVPAEWVDIPGFTADYYLAAQVILAEEDDEEDYSHLRISGYTTWKDLKQGDYDEFSRTYFLEREDLSEEVEYFLTHKEARTKQNVDVKALPNLSAPLPTEALVKKLVEEVSKPSGYSPRYKLPLDQWLPLIGDDNIRQQIYQNRTSEIRKPIFSGGFRILKPGLGVIRKTRIRLLEKIYEAADNLIETLNQGVIFRPNTLGYTPATIEEQEQEEAVIADADFISELDNLLDNNDNDDLNELASELANLLNTKEINEQSKLILPSIIQLLTTLDINTPNVVEAITSLSEKVTDDEVVYAVAFSLARLQPDHEKAAQIKYNTPLEITSHEIQDEIYLCVATLPKEESNDQKQKRLWVQIVNNNPTRVLPLGLKLAVFSDADELLYELETDNLSLILTEDDTLPLFSLGTNLHISVNFLQDVVKEIDIIV